MANREIIDIQVNDETFKKFHEAFSEYAEKLDEQPQKWRKLNDAMSATGKEFSQSARQSESDMTAAAMLASTLHDHLKQAGHSQQDFERATKKSHKAMKALAHSVGHVGKGLAHIAKFAGVIGGLGVGASLFAIPDLAGSAMRTSRRARSLGLSSGQMNAFDLNMENVFGSSSSAHSYLEQVANAQNNPQNPATPGIMALTGMSYSQYANESAPKLAVQLAQSMHKFAKSHSKQYLETYLKSYGLEQLFPLGRARILKGKSSSQIANAGKQALSPAEARSLGFSRRQGEQMTNLSVQMHKSGARIENDLIRRLSAVSGGFGHLSKIISKDADSLINNALSPRNLKALNHGIEDFANFIGSPKFLKDLHAFGKGIGEVAHDVMWVAKKLDWITKGQNAPAKEAAAGGAGILLASKSARAAARLAARGTGAASEALGTDALLGPVGVLAGAMTPSVMGNGTLFSEFNNKALRNMGAYSMAAFEPLNTTGASPVFGGNKNMPVWQLLALIAKHTEGTHRALTRRTGSPARKTQSDEPSTALSTFAASK